MWISAVGLGACSSDWVEPDPVVPDANPGGDRWVRCCGVESSPWVETRGAGDWLECLCPGGSTCNWEQTCWQDWDWEDAAPMNDAGFAEAGAMEDPAIDALVIADDSGPSSDATTDAVVSMDDAAIDALLIADDAGPTDDRQDAR